MTFSWWTEIRSTTEGLALIKDWLGDGGVPVERKEAERRAVICSCCPLNKFKNWWDRAKDSIAGTIKKQIEIKNRIGLQTTLDDDLAMCGGLNAEGRMQGCGCATKLKVWTPMEHISRHTSREVYLSFPPHCWVRQGIDALNKKPPA